jgi:heptosyltransferase-2
MSLEFDSDKIKRILVRGVNWVGDTILTYPTLQILKSFFPKSHIAILIHDSLIDLWKTFPFIDEIISFQRKKGFRSLFEDLNLAISLRKKKFDLAIILPRSFHSAFQIFLGGIPIRIGFENEFRSIFLTHKISRRKEIYRIPRIKYYMKLVELFGKIEKIPSPNIFLRNEDRKWAYETLKDLGLSDAGPLIGMNPGATYGLSKCWYPDRFGELGRRLSKRWNGNILIFGKKEEKVIAEEILKILGDGGIDLTGKTSLLQLAALLEKCNLLITNDTGTMHIATAVGTSVVALFGSTDPLTTGPWGEGHVVLRKELPCSPCLKRICPTKHSCMKLITVDEVEEAVNLKLEEILSK